MAKIYCSCCGKQAIKGSVPENDQHITTLNGAKASFKSTECICGHCAKELDENGNFPNEGVIDSDEW